MNENPPSSPARPWQPRFSILGMMLATMVVAVGAAAVSYLVRSGDFRSGSLLFLIVTFVGPPVLIITVSVTRAIVAAWHRSRARKLKTTRSRSEK